MLRGRRYRLTRPTLALSYVDRDRRAVTLPDGAILHVLSGPLNDDDRMVDVDCDGQKLTLFLQDLKDRGVEVSDAKTGRG